MALQDFLRWLGFTDLPNLQHNTAVLMVKETIDSLAEESSEEARRARRDLEPIYRHLQDGGIPESELGAYYDKYSYLLQQKPVASGPALEKELRKLASDLEEDQSGALTPI